MKNQITTQHSDDGYYFSLGDTKAFVYEKGKGEPVVCFHGVPASSFLYRKVIGKLAEKGYRGISFDIIGTGLSDRPEDFDYSWTNLGKWCTDLIQKLKLDKFHIVLHDIGGPIGSEVIANLPNSILSVTVLNTMLANLGDFTKPFPMNYYEHKGLGEVIVRSTNGFFFKKLMENRGINIQHHFTYEDADAYVYFQKGSDGGKSFLKIMRSFEATHEKGKLYLDAINSLKVPKKIIWGTKDKALTLEKYGIPLQKEMGLSGIVKTEGKHFLQEDYFDLIASEISKMNPVS